MERVEKRRQWLWSSGIARRWMKSYRAYYGLADSADSSELAFVGKQGELVSAKANHYRALVQQTLNMTTAQKPAVTPVASNTDYDSLAETQLASGLLDYYWKTKRLFGLWKRAVELALVMSEGNILRKWDVNAGEDEAADLESGTTVKQGDLVFSVLSPLDVTRDTGVTSADKSQWVITEERQNRHDLIATAPSPEVAEKLRAIKDDFSKRTTAIRIGAEASDVETDQISVYTLFHAKTDALPQGRMMVLASAECVLFDGPLPYKRIPVDRIAPGELLGTAFGYSTMFDLLGLQEGVDMLTSIPLTNQSAFGVQNILMPEDSNISRKDLGGGLNVIKYAVKNGVALKPEALQLTSTPAEVFAFRTEIRSDMQTISGNNSVTMGNVDRQMSGAAMALQASMSLQYHSGLQDSAAALVEDMDTGIIETLQLYATSERVAAIAGKSETYTLVSFTAEKLSNITRVTVEPVNPLTKTQQGRLEIAQMLMNQGSVTPKQFLTFINSGKLEPLFENEQANLLRIRKDKEMLMQGKKPTPLVTDTHWLDIPEYLSVLAMPDARTKPAVVSAVLAIVQQKLDLWRTMDPALLQLLGGPPPPAAIPAGPPSMTQPPAAGEPTQTPPPMAPQNGDSTTGPRMPSMPKNPVTGQQFEAPAGQMPLQ